MLHEIVLALQGALADEVNQLRRKAAVPMSQVFQVIGCHFASVACSWDAKVNELQGKG